MMMMMPIMYLCINAAGADDDAAAAGANAHDETTMVALMSRV